MFDVSYYNLPMFGYSKASTLTNFIIINEKPLGEMYTYIYKCVCTS